MSLYPSLEDMKVDQMMKAQSEAVQRTQSVPTPPAYASAPTLPYPLSPGSAPAPAGKYASLYPSLDDYMGLKLVPEEASQIPQQQQAVAPVVQQNQVAVPSSVGQCSMVAPLSGNSAGLLRAQVSHGIRELTLCKDAKGKVGLRVQPINKGVFVILVQKGTPAALAGLRFGDQILMIDDVVVAGFSMDKVHDRIRKANPQKITMVVRDRPFERTLTVHKDSLGNVGFGFKNGKIISLVKDSSAARNGLLIDHNMLEVNGQNVVGLKDKEITSIIKEGGNIITLTVMPSFVFDHMIKHTASSFLKKTMDHSVPDI